MPDDQTAQQQPANQGAQPADQPGGPVVDQAANVPDREDIPGPEAGAKATTKAWSQPEYSEGANPHNDGSEDPPGLEPSGDPTGGLSEGQTGQPEGAQTGIRGTDLGGAASGAGAGSKLDKEDLAYKNKLKDSVDAGGPGDTDTADTAARGGPPDPDGTSGDSSAASNDAKSGGGGGSSAKSSGGTSGGGKSGGGSSGSSASSSPSTGGSSSKSTGGAASGKGTSSK